MITESNGKILFFPTINNVFKSPLSRNKAQPLSNNMLWVEPTFLCEVHI